jgi:tetrahydromethanopterin S-methyltransferase subunit E
MHTEKIAWGIVIVCGVVAVIVLAIFIIKVKNDARRP